MNSDPLGIHLEDWQLDDIEFNNGLLRACR
jgi:hypothetical protein